MIKQLAAFATGILWVVVAGCGHLEASRRLVNSFETPEALVQAVLDKLAERDEAGLLAYMVTRDEHRELFWDQLPESKHLPFDYARHLNLRNSTKGVRRAIEKFGGQEFEVVSLRFTGEPESYDGFTIHFVDDLTVRRVSDGVTGPLPILDVIVEWHGRWKLMNYDEL